MEFSPVFDWVDVPDPGNPPPGARLISAEDLLRYENALVAAKGELELLGGAGQRGYVIEQTAGRVVKVWDYLNNREQLIYGETGWRDVTALAGAGVTAGMIRIKRDAQTVTLHLDLVKVTGTGIVDLPVIPSGFQDGRWFRHQMALGETIRIAGANLRLETAAPTDSYDGMISWPAYQPWPTSLPGVAV